MESALMTHLIMTQQSDANIVWSLLTKSRGVVLVVLILLILFSLACWGIILFKWLQLNQAQKQSTRFLDVFWEVKDIGKVYQETEMFDKSPIAQVFRAGTKELEKVQRSQQAQSSSQFGLGGIDNVVRAMRRATNQEMALLEKYTSFLATTASAAPFVGLFGTVWGVMKSFIAIHNEKSVGLSVVAPGMAEALIATAVGIAAAIPAVIAYNYFNAKLNTLSVEMDNFSNDFLNIVKRHFLK